MVPPQPLTPSAAYDPLEKILWAPLTKATSQAVLPPEKIALSPEWRTVSRIFISGPWQVC